MARNIGQYRSVITQFMECITPNYNSYGHLLVITGYNWDYTCYKWGYKYL